MSITQESKLSYLGTLLQVTATVASISIALYAALYTLDLQSQDIKLPHALYWGLGISGNLNLWAHVLALRELKKLLEAPDNIFFQIGPLGATFWGIVFLWFVYVMFVIPGLPEAIVWLLSGHIPH